jgi:prepilin-type N-terminal cleavage/methylation domain-containing protein/prepilin-type processing-associated H-X9-DG protein
MTKRIHAPRKGFTLIELLTVIAIIGILASILIPTVGAVLNTAHKAAAANNASQIAKTYVSYSNGSTNPRNIKTTQQAGSTGGDRTTGVASTINDVAFILSQKAELNDASLWFITSDDNLAGVTIPKSVIEGDPSTATDVGPGFSTAQPKSWAFVIGLSTSAPSTTTPVIWTYGLSTAGKWSTTKSPWKGTGGHMAFLDGHVEWFDQLNQADPSSSLVVYPGNPNPGTATNDYTQAINSQTTNPAQVVNDTGTGGVGQ